MDDKKKSSSNEKILKAVWEKLFDTLDELHTEIKEKLNSEKEKQQPIQSK